MFVSLDNIRVDAGEVGYESGEMDGSGPVHFPVAVFGISSDEICDSITTIN
jgi:hypothetical protein